MLLKYLNGIRAAGETHALTLQQFEHCLRREGVGFYSPEPILQSTEILRCKEGELLKKMKQDLAHHLRMDPEEFQFLIGEHPHWRLEDPETLRRDYRFTSQQTATAFALYVSEVARELRRGPAVEIRDSELTLRIGSRGGLTESDFAVVAAIDRAG